MPNSQENNQINTPRPSDKSRSSDKPPFMPGLRRVFVLTDDGTKNLLPAAGYGEIRVFTATNISPYHHKWVSDLRVWLAAFRHGSDYLLLTGDPVLIAVAASILVDRGINPLSLLKWDRQEKKYIHVEIMV